MVASARRLRERETPRNTFSGVALYAEQIVGLHVLRFYDEYEGPAAHIAGLWVHADYRRIGIARKLKADREAWARSVGGEFPNTNVASENTAMLRLDETAGFSVFRLNMRKDLRSRGSRVASVVSTGARALLQFTLAPAPPR